MTDIRQGTLTNLINKVDEHARAGDGISIGLIQQIVGRRAAGPLLLIPALVVISPLSNPSQPRERPRRSPARNFLGNQNPRPSAPHALPFLPFKISPANRFTK